MTWLLLSWIGAAVMICCWVSGATMNGADLDEEQIARRMGSVA
jgi:hypothetical protein